MRAVLGLDHVQVQVAVPIGGEAITDAFHGGLLGLERLTDRQRSCVEDPWGNRVELLAM